MPEILEIDPWKVKVLISRPRDAEGHAQAIEDTRRRGQVEPGEVVDIRHWTDENRRRPDGKLADWGLIAGEGRLGRAEALKRKFLAVPKDEKEIDWIGRWQSENFNRKALPWVQMARLIQPDLAAGKSAETIAKALSVSPGHVLKLKRILDKTAEGLEEDRDRMTVNEAEVFTTLSKGGQRIVIEEFHQTKDASIRELVKFAKKVSEETGEELSRTALRKSLDRLDEDLHRMRDRMKLARLHHALGPVNLQLLLEDRQFRAALIKEGANVAKFEKLCQSAS